MHGDEEAMEDILENKDNKKEAGLKEQRSTETLRLEAGGQRLEIGEGSGDQAMGEGTQTGPGGLPHDATSENPEGKNRVLYSRHLHAEAIATYCVHKQHFGDSMEVTQLSIHQVDRNNVRLPTERES
ncbi:hypothetical protein C8J57DRAFT_1240647 [Mycena rebaudengoi]|nr:hypothetical protein C8J57DRAFT_1240647 [Mycena rebaudengoi]